MTDNTNPLAFLRNQEPFQQMKRLLQQNPNMFGALLRHVGQSNPELFNIIRQNRDAFMLLVNEPDQSKLKIKKKKISLVENLFVRHFQLHKKTRFLRFQKWQKNPSLH